MEAVDGKTVIIGKQERRKYKRRKRYLAPNIEEMERLSRELAEYNAENGMTLAEKEAIWLEKCEHNGWC